MGPIYQKLASLRASSKRSRQNCWKSWAVRTELVWGRAPSPVQRGRSPAAYDAEPHYAYEDEDQTARWDTRNKTRTPVVQPSGPTYNSIGNIAEFFASRGKKFSLPKVVAEAPKGKQGFRPGQRVKHPKYGEGTVYQREGDGEDAKITVQFPRFGLKKLVEKYAQLERA